MVRSAPDAFKVDSATSDRSIASRCRTPLDPSIHERSLQQPVERRGLRAPRQVGAAGGAGRGARHRRGGPSGCALHAERRGSRSVPGKKPACALARARASRLRSGHAVPSGVGGANLTAPAVRLLRGAPTSAPTSPDPGRRDRGDPEHAHPQRGARRPIAPGWPRVPRDWRPPPAHLPGQRRARALVPPRRRATLQRHLV